jgi:hypothetical protein
VTTETTEAPGTAAPEQDPAAGGQRAETPAAGLDTTLRGSRVLAAMGGEERYRDLLAAFDAAKPEALVASYRARPPALPHREPAPVAESLPGLPPWQDETMRQFDRDHDDETARIDPAPGRSREPARAGVATWLRRRQRPYRTRERDACPLEEPPPPFAAPVPADETALDGIPRIPRYMDEPYPQAARHARQAPWPG